MFSPFEIWTGNLSKANYFSSLLPNYYLYKRFYFLTFTNTFRNRRTIRLWRTIEQRRETTNFHMNYYVQHNFDE